MTSTNTGSAAALPPLRVLAVTPRYLPSVGGTEIHTFETAKRVAAKHHDVTVLTASLEREFAGDEKSDGVRIVRVRAWPSNRDYYIAPGIIGIIARRSWDLVHCQGVHTFFTPLAMLAAWRSGIPYVVTFHSGGHSSRLRTRVRGAQWALLRPLLKRAARLICVSEFESAYFRDRLRLDSERFIVIPNGAQLLAPPPVEECQFEGATIVSLGRLERYKGHHRVIAALPHVLARRPDTRLRIVGSGPFESELMRLARDLGVADRVEIGVIPGSDRGRLASVLAQAAVVTLLSDYESQGIAAVEAVKLRRPVLVADSSALQELADRGLARAVSLDSSPEQVAQAILEQISQPLIPPDVDLPTWDDCAASLLDLYHSVVRSPRCAS